MSWRGRIVGSGTGAHTRTGTGAHTRTGTGAHTRTGTGAHTRTGTGAHTRTDKHCKVIIATGISLAVIIVHYRWKISRADLLR